ncbi:MAG: hypothetical protein ABSB41_12035 [Anaerolineales bacterium]
MRAIRVVLLMGLILLMLVPHRQAKADAAPPMNPAGGNVSPEGGTRVEMAAEQVTIDFRSSTDDSAKVTAWFLFHNTGNADEHLKVRFPLNGDERVNALGQTYYPMIQDLTALIDGQLLPTQVVQETDSNAAQFFLGYSNVMYWSEFEVDFPVGKDVKLVVKYTLQPTAEACYADVNYILATGAGWKGPIGKADVVLRFPYILNMYNLPDFNDYSVNTYLSSYAQSAGYTAVIENELWFHYGNLEPTNQDNIRVSIIQPHLWQAVVERRSQVIASPDDASAWLALARAYADAGQEKHGMFINDQVIQVFIQAFERALILNPNNASLHVEFATDMLSTDIEGNDYYRSIFLNELATALALDPKNANALSLLDTMNQNFPGTVLPTPGPFPIYVSPTPTLETTAVPPLPISTTTPQPTSTLIPSSTPPQPTPSPTQVPGGTSFNLTGLAILLVAVFAVGTGSGILITRHQRR